MAHQETSLPHTGIATFCKAPYTPDLEDCEADVVVLGIPYDGATAMRPGSRSRTLRPTRRSHTWCCSTSRRPATL